MKTTTQWYKENPEKYLKRKQQIKDRQTSIRRYVQEYRKGKVCVLCGFSDYRAIDFHHRDKDSKTITPSEIYLKGWGVQRIQEELNKCDPMCKNCHAILHHPDTSV
jgi:hypothetical protein